jgi:hypothetical protein
MTSIYPAKAFSFYFNSLLTLLKQHKIKNPVSDKTPAGSVFATYILIQLVRHKFNQFFSAHFIRRRFICTGIFKLRGVCQVMNKLLLRLARTCYMYVGGILQVSGNFFKKFKL